LAAVKSKLGIAETDLAKGMEINGGFVIWNNRLMAQIKLFKNCSEIAAACLGCFEGNQDLLAFVAASKKIPITELDYPYHLLLARPRGKRGSAVNPLRADASREYFGDVRVIHFIDPKPWASGSVGRLSQAQIHFINAWRNFAQHALGADSKIFFSELSPLPGDPVQRLIASFTARRDSPARQWVAGWKRLVK
jgi:lipopolysaccharide biosynthesis glycosyltransferase